MSAKADKRGTYRSPLYIFDGDNLLVTHLGIQMKKLDDLRGGNKYAK